MSYVTIVGNQNFIGFFSCQNVNILFFPGERETLPKVEAFRDEAETVSTNGSHLQRHPDVKPAQRLEPYTVPVSSTYHYPATRNFRPRPAACRPRLCSCSSASTHSGQSRICCGSARSHHESSHSSRHIEEHKLVILTWNVANMTRSKTREEELCILVTKQQPDVVLITEAELNTYDTVVIPGYVTFLASSANSGKCRLFALVKHDLSVTTTVLATSHMDIWLHLKLAEPLTIVGVYRQ